MNDCAANKTLVKKLFDEWINKKNLAAIDEMVTPNYVSHEGGEDANAEDTKKFLAGLFRSAPDIHVTIEDIVCEGDKVVVRNIWRATDTGGFGGTPNRKESRRRRIRDVANRERQTSGTLGSN